MSDRRFAASTQNSSSPPRLGVLPEWNLGDLYSGLNAPQLQADLAKAKSECKDFARDYAGKIETILSKPDAAKALLQAVRRYEAIDDLLGRIMSYAGLVYAGDTTDPAGAKFYGDTTAAMTVASSDLLFFQLELNGIDEDKLDELIAKGDLAHYRPWFVDIRRERPFQLDDRLEKLFLEKSVTGSTAWNRLFDDTISALRFRIKGKSLAIAPTLNLLQNPDETVRREAAQALGKGLKAQLRTFTLITNTLAKDKEISDQWRGFNDVAAARHLSNRVEPEVVDALATAVEQAYPRLSHRYYRLKARWFGKDKLDHWDRNAPLPDMTQKIYAWSEAQKIVLDAYGAFSPKMAEIGATFFDCHWIDAPVRPGKSPGAFAHPTVPSAHPYILLNYQGLSRDVMTLAHELGHGVHQVLAAHNGPLMAPTPLTLAETASVFGEMLTFRKLLDQASDKKQRKAMLAAKVEDMINTVVRQIAFYLFERRLHNERRKGELTSDAINALWMDVQQQSLGPSVVLHKGYESYWCYIPHFIHSPFYVYAYAFGDCLVNSLYGVYRRTPEGFAEKYITLLSAGGTLPYNELMAPFGLDARDPNFWNIGLTMIEGFITELEAMES